MNVMQRIRRAFVGAPSSAPSVWTPWHTAPFSAGWLPNIRECNDASLLAFSAVFACVSIISSDLAKLPVRVLRTRPDGGTEAVPDHPVARLLARPNPYQTRVDFFQQWLASMLLSGNGYAFKSRSAAGAVAALHVLDPARVRVLVADDGAAFYEITSPQGTATLPASEVVHHRVFTAAHPLSGISPMYAAASSAAVGARIVMNSNRFFANAARPSGALLAPGKISKETAQRLKEEFARNYSGDNTGSPAVLSEGLTWTSMTLTASDSQLIEQLRYSVEDVARAFRVPSFLLGDMTKATYRNSEQLMRLYYSGCLQYHIEALEARLDADLGIEAGHGVEFDLDALLRSDSAGRFEVYKAGIGSGVLTINEARRSEGLPPVAGGDVPFIQVQNVPLSVAASAKAPPAPTPPVSAP